MAKRIREAGDMIDGDIAQGIRGPGIQKQKQCARACVFALVQVIQSYVVNTETRACQCGRLCEGIDRSSQVYAGAGMTHATVTNRHIRNLAHGAGADT